MQKSTKNGLCFNLFITFCALCLTLTGCGGISQEAIDEADRKLGELNEMRAKVESGYGGLTDDSLFSRVTDAGQLLDALAESSASRYNDMSEEELQTLWMAKANELTGTYSSLQELIDQAAQAQAEVKKAAENRFDLRFHVVNKSGVTLRDLCWYIVDDTSKRILLETKGTLADGASLAGVTVPTNREYGSYELRLTAADSAGENRVWHISDLSDINPDASFYLTLEPEGKATLSVTPPA
ncbi:MAG: hypothetical protein K6C95_01705 [Lachnospiraceae bacterium]|nr:hypothetical protein [Lachnospiraceae bacterium]